MKVNLKVTTSQEILFYTEGFEQSGHIFADF